MLEILERQEQRHFAGIIMGDESWFFSSTSEIVYRDSATKMPETDLTKN
jgi:hypothetical protein